MGSTYIKPNKVTKKAKHVTPKSDNIVIYEIPMAIYHYNDAEETTVIEHEIGHSIGLAHNESTTSIMYLAPFHQTISNEDTTAIKNLYNLK